MRRVAVIGASGSGKSTLATALSARLGVVAIDLDTLFHRPNWEPTPTPEFRPIVAAALGEADGAHGGWVVAGNYLMVADIVHRRADTIVWLDPPRWRSTLRVVRRSLRRVLRRERLWNGNRERLRSLLSRDPEINIILWSWTSQPGLRTKFETLSGTPLWAETDVRRLRSRSDVDLFLDVADEVGAGGQAASSSDASSADG